MKKILSNLFLLLLLVSCTSQPQQSTLVYDDFAQTQELKSKELPLDTAVFRYPFRIHIQDRMAAVLDLHGADHFLQLFSYPEFRHIASFGKRGDSPDDMLSVENIRWGGQFLWTLDANKRELTKFAFSKSDGSPLRDETVSLDKKILRALDFVQCDDSNFIIPDYSGDSRFCMVNRKGELLYKFGTIPTTNEDALAHSRPALAQAWRSFIDYNPRKKVLAAVTQLGEVLEIYNLKDTASQIVRIGPNGEPKFKIARGYSIPTGIMGFSDVQVTDKAIYAAFQGRTFKELASQPKDKKVTGGQYIYVFSLKGEPLMKYVLDRHITGISVDEKRGIITATDVNSDEPIVEYRMK